jgi:hypothetical protein
MRVSPFYFGEWVKATILAIPGHTLQTIGGNQGKSHKPELTEE